MNDLPTAPERPEPKPRLHLHLDPVGGFAGDMFVASLLHAFPAHETAVLDAIRQVVDAPCRLLPAGDGVLTGARFDVGTQDHHHHHHDHHHDHHFDNVHSGHAAWSGIRRRIENAGLPAGVRDRAIDIFTHLAQAEAQVHGITPDEVTFHEVGAEDSIADILGAAALIEAIAPVSWSVSPLPLGAGLVRTQHGLLPVPAPATALLLEGFETFDDGIPGERVTPTGAAILRHLMPIPRKGLGGRLVRSGHGFGTRILPGMSNVLRVLAFETEAAAGETHRALAVISFEVDDQSAEDLAIGLDRLRDLPGVHDASQMPVFGKKGRMATHIQVLARPEALETVVEACFRETTTIGLRTHLVDSRTLPRAIETVSAFGAALRVKRVERPGGATGKTEAEDLRTLPGRAARERHRRAAEAAAGAGDE